MREPAPSSGLRALARVLGMLPPGLGQHRVAARFAAGQHGDGRARWVEQRLVDGARVRLDLADRIQAETFLLRRYEPEIVEAIARHLPEGGVFVDGGANVGLVTFAVGARRPDVAIHAFEPEPLSAAAWRVNAALNPSIRARLEPAALGETSGTVELSDAAERSETHVHVGGSPSGGSSAPVTTLDAYAEAHGLGTIDVLKLDLEGYEPLALRGARGLLDAGRIRCLICEFLAGYLERYGFRRDEVVRDLMDRGFRLEELPVLGLRRLRRHHRIPDLLLVRD